MRELSVIKNIIEIIKIGPHAKDYLKELMRLLENKSYLSQPLNKLSREQIKRFSSELEKTITQLEKTIDSPNTPQDQLLEVTSLKSALDQLTNELADLYLSTGPTPNVDEKHTPNADEKQTTLRNGSEGASGVGTPVMLMLDAITTTLDPNQPNTFLEAVYLSLEKVGLEKCFYPYMSRQEAEKILNRQPNGSYLLRCSTNPSQLGLLAVSCKTQENSVEHYTLRLGQYTDELPKNIYHPIVIESKHTLKNIHPNPMETSDLTQKAVEYLDKALLPYFVRKLPPRSTNIINLNHTPLKNLVFFMYIRQLICKIHHIGVTPNEHFLLKLIYKYILPNFNHPQQDCINYLAKILEGIYQESPSVGQKRKPLAITDFQVIYFAVDLLLNNIKLFPLLVADIQQANIKTPLMGGNDYFLEHLGSSIVLALNSYHDDLQIFNLIGGFFFEILYWNHSLRTAALMLNEGEYLPKIEERASKLVRFFIEGHMFTPEVWRKVVDSLIECPSWDDALPFPDSVLIGVLGGFVPESLAHTVSQYLGGRKETFIDYIKDIISKSVPKIEKKEEEAQEASTTSLSR